MSSTTKNSSSRGFGRQRQRRFLLAVPSVPLMSSSSSPLLASKLAVLILTTMVLVAAFTTRALTTTRAFAFQRHFPSVYRGSTSGAQARSRPQEVRNSVGASSSVLLPRRIALFSTASASEVDEVKAQIKIKGDEIRALKADGVAKDELAPHVEELLALKARLPPDNETTTAEAKATPAKTKAKKNNNNKQQQNNNKKPEEMSESELRLNRLSKVEAMKEAGVEPFEYSYPATHKAGQLLELYDGKLEPGEEEESADVAVAGRIMTRRVFGKLAFFTLQDETGTVQLQFDKNRLGDTFKVRQVILNPKKVWISI